ncbi:hypothetical protein, partial [Cryobacterium sp. Y29]|uniref:hypothetical protein n=1 Tax=Cryobacterium sp. Y29 TaxID=2048285 RepID=UPI0018EDE38F
QPEWASELGEVPADTDRRQQWTELAAEVDVFRTQYRIDPQETVAVPADYRQRTVGADLAERVTAMHKSQVLSSRPAATEDDRQRAAAAATTAALRARQTAAARPGTTAVKAPQKATDATSTAQKMKEQQQKRAAERVEQLRRQGVNVKVQKAGDRNRQSGADQAPARDQGIER